MLQLYDKNTTQRQNTESERCSPIPCFSYPVLAWVRVRKLCSLHHSLTRRPQFRLSGICAAHFSAFCSFHVCNPLLIAASVVAESLRYWRRLSAGVRKLLCPVDRIAASRSQVLRLQGSGYFCGIKLWLLHQRRKGSYRCSKRRS